MVSEAPARLRGRRRRVVARLVGVAALILFLALVAGVVLPRPLFAPAIVENADATRTILLLSNPIHTDIALPLDVALAERFGFLEDAGLPLRHEGARFLVFGWGGREFYLRTPTWADLEWGAVARSLTLDASVMHVAVSGPIDVGHPAVTPLALSPAGYTAMLDAIEASFSRRGTLGLPVPVGHGYGNADAFFEAEGRFNVALGCNTWTAAMLRAGGMRTGVWTPLPPLLRWSLRLHNGGSGGERKAGTVAGAGF